MLTLHNNVRKKENLKEEERRLSRSRREMLSRPKDAPPAAKRAISYSRVAGAHTIQIQIPVAAIREYSPFLRWLLSVRRKKGFYPILPSSLLLRRTIPCLYFSATKREALAA